MWTLSLSSDLHMAVQMAVLAPGFAGASALSDAFRDHCTFHYTKYNFRGDRRHKTIELRRSYRMSGPRTPVMSRKNELPQSLGGGPLSTVVQDVKPSHDYKTGDHQKDIRNEIPAQASPAHDVYMTTPVSPNHRPCSGVDPVVPDEAVKFIKNLKNIVIHLLNHQMVNTWKEDCNGCVTGHPSQKQHTCLYNYPEEYLQKNYDRVVRGLWNERLVDTVSRFLFAHGTPATNARIQGAVEAVLFEMQQAENIHQKLDEMYKNLPDDWITSAFMDTCLNMWRNKPDYQN
ncbi:hypothetical protein WMY93_018708 [Mugilogobius chulae]|uniref:Uncharacterized protein n=1 Tax=Mugilogobius chulae TaxID=88201 RepID=A0AAW0NNY8_9GOBI